MRLEQIVSSASGMDYQYTSYDGVSNILTKSTEHGNYVYDYDGVYRVMDVDNPTLDDEVYTYDGVGNRLTSADVSGSWSYNANNELLGYADVEYTYDENGNMVQKRVGTAAVNYIYDAANRLVKVEDDATQTVIADYYYDPFGRRLWKDVSGVSTYFFYSDEGLIGEYDANGAEIRSYGYQPDSMWMTNPLWLKEGGSYYWYQNDLIGTPQKLVDVNGVIVWSAEYTAFGEAVVDIETVTNNLRFPGQYEDAETGLHDNFHRYYDPGIGRYVRTDPIGFEGGDVNWYAYVWNNPLDWVDMMGLYTRSCDEYKEKFFNWLKHHIPVTAKELNIPENFLWALGAKEGGWSEKPIINDPDNPGQKVSAFLRNIREHMPFGVQDPETKQNKYYKDLDAAFEDWKKLYGNRVKGKKTIQEFTDALQCVGVPTGEHCNKYNSETGDWAEQLVDRYNQVIGEPNHPKEYRRVGFKELCKDICDLGEE